MRLVAHIAKTDGGSKGDLRTPLCGGKPRRLSPTDRALFACQKCLVASIELLNAHGRPTYVSNSTTTTVTVTKTDRGAA